MRLTFRAPIGSGISRRRTTALARRRSDMMPEPAGHERAEFFDRSNRASDVASRLVGRPDAELAAVVDAATLRLRDLSLPVDERRRLTTERAPAEALLRDRSRRRGTTGAPGSRSS
jgi:hypothetical protein